VSVDARDFGRDDGWLAQDPVARQSTLRPDVLAAQEFATGRALTFRQLDLEVRRCETVLRDLATDGGRVALLARNSLRHIVLFYACPRAGRVFQPLNWRLSGGELAVLLADASPDLVIYEAEFEKEALAALAAMPEVRRFKVTPGADDPFAALVAAAEPHPPTPVDPNAPAALLYTSGTTGRPKGVIITAKSATYGSLNFLFVGELTAGHAQLCDAPFFHIVGILAVIHASVMAGATLHISDRFAPPLTLQRLADPTLAITHYFCVPQMAQALLDDPGFAAADLSRLRLFTGGAPMPAHLTLRLCDAGIRPSNGYGMSENGTVLGVPLDIETARRKVGSAGIVAPLTQVRIVRPDGADAADGEVGEIWLRGPAITPGYWNQPEATAKAFAEDWFRSGDAARRDADGYYFIVDRWKDMYISGGENVYPAEVEAVLAAMDCVADVAVIGVDDERWGEVGCAYVVLRRDSACDAAAVQAWCADRLARYKRPTHLRFTEALPRTASGKVQKDVLRRAFAAAIQTELPS
jgi:fatty-acyl-CoA synthase